MREGKVGMEPGSPSKLENLGPQQHPPMIAVFCATCARSMGIQPCVPLVENAWAQIDGACAACVRRGTVMSLYEFCLDICLAGWLVLALCCLWVCFSVNLLLLVRVVSKDRSLDPFVHCGVTT